MIEIEDKILFMSSQRVIIYALPLTCFPSLWTDAEKQKIFTSKDEFAASIEP